jgi:hypothetical protein
MNPTVHAVGAALAVLTLSAVPSSALAQAGPRAGTGTAAVPYAVAVRFARPPELDGRLDEWTQQPLVLDHRAHLLTDSADYAGDADLSARVWFAWDDSTLYVAGAVVDDDVTRGEAWDRDRVNLVFDWRNDTTPLTYGQRSPPTSSWQSDDYWVYFQPFWEKGPGLVQRMDRHGQGPAAGARLASRRTADGYTFEAAIPASALPEYSPFAAAVAGLQVFVSDGDRGQPLTELMWSAAWAHDNGLAWELDRMGRLVFAGTAER